MTIASQLHHSATHKTGRDENCPVCQRETEPEYLSVLAAVRSTFAGLTGPLFTTDTANLFSVYLESFAPAERNHHDCRACQRFIDAFGGLVVIGEDGTAKSAMWNPASIQGNSYKEAFRQLERVVSKARVTGVFLSSEAVWGKPTTGIWNHFSITPSSVFAATKLKDAFQAMAEKRQDFGTVARALDEFGLGVVTNAVALLQSDALYRSEKVLGQAVWLLDLHALRAATKNELLRNNLIWRAVAQAPAGFCHPRSSMIGTLLEDLAAGMSVESVRDRFAAKMHPLQYQRPQAAPSAGNIAQAEKIIAELGLASSLRRRFARLADLQAMWKPRDKPQAGTPGGVFSHLAPKAPSETAMIELPPQTRTWAKFHAEVIPGAVKIEYFVPSSAMNYSPFVTASDPEAPPILQWDYQDRRNPVSWYVYHAMSMPARFNLSPGYVDVAAIVDQPSHWDTQRICGHVGEGVTFVLAGCRDMQSETTSLGLFPEMLRADLREIRSTIEAYSSKGRIEGNGNESAAGIKITKPGPWPNMRFRVTSETGMRAVYVLDRWD